MPPSSPPLRRKLCLEALEDRTTPTFADPVNLPVQYNPNILTVADFNNDGNPDVGTAFNGNYTRAVFLRPSRYWLLAPPIVLVL
jgi:hypothetical protein